MNIGPWEEDADEDSGDADRIADDSGDNAMNEDGSYDDGDLSCDEYDLLSPDEAFDNLCAALEKDDPTKTTVCVPFEVAGYGSRLGNALVGNTHAENITLSLWPEDVSSPLDENWGVENISLILQYLREGTAFRTLTVESGELEYVRLCVAAIAQNPGTTKLILKEDAEIPIAEVAELLRTSQSLKSIAIPMVNSQELAEAFQANQTLDFMSLMFDPDEHPEPDGVILYHLIPDRRPCALTVAQKYDCSNMDTLLVDTAISTLLSKTVWLTEFRLSGMCFSINRMQLLMEALLSNRSIEKLGLCSCEFDDMAVSFLHALVMSPSHRGAFAESAIRELSMADEDINGNLVALCVLGFPRLQILEWKWKHICDTLDAFWNLLAANPSMVKLQVVKLLDWPGVSDQEMNICIPLLPTLRELRFDMNRYFFDNKIAPAFCHSVRRSSGLTDVSVFGEFPTFWNETESRIVRASFQRNRNLPGLVSMPRTGHVAQAGDGCTEIYLYPSLFHAATQSLRVAPNSIFTGLLALEDAIELV
jgi:hypothetical protein